MTSNNLLPLIGLAFLGASASLNSAFAQATTTPAGYFTVTAAAGTGTSAATTVLSFPLQGTANITGEAVGIITGVTSNTITNTNAGWTAGQLSVAATPYLIQITSGTAAGRYFLLSTSTANTSTVATLDASETTNLTTLGINVGTDTYQIVPADTISTVFGAGNATGTGAPLGSTASSSADTVVLYNGAAYVSYFYDTTTSVWSKAFPTNNSNNVVIRPDTGALYYRLANTTLPITVMGQVPAVGRQTTVSNQTTTFLSSYFPTNVSLLNSNIQNIPGWVTGSSSAVSDTVAINSGVAWKQYYFDGTHWYVAFPKTVSDSINIPAGSTVIITRINPTAGTSILSEALPYSLN